MKRIEFWFEYVAGYLMTNPRKQRRYHRYMWEKYGTMYCTQDQWDEYWNRGGDSP